MGGVGTATIPQELERRGRKHWGTNRSASGDHREGGGREDLLKSNQKDVETTCMCKTDG